MLIRLQIFIKKFNLYVMICPSMSYKEAQIIRDTWPSLYTYQRILEDEKKKNDLEDLGSGPRREGG
jgi:hypothetical protein